MNRFRIIVIAGSKRSPEWQALSRNHLEGRTAGEFRAYGYERPSHRLADLKLKWREMRIRAGVPPAGSSPAHQQRLDIDA